MGMGYEEKTKDELIEENTRLRHQFSELEDEVALLKKRRDFFFKQQEAAISILKTTPDFFVLKNRDGVYQFANAAFCRFLNKSEQEIIGKTDRDLFPSEEADIYMRDDSRVMRECRPQIQDEAASGKQGKRWLHVSKDPVTDDSGVVIGILCSVRDITDRKVAESELQKKMKSLEAIKTLTGIVPICAWCNNIRDNNGNWHLVADFLRDHTEAEFTHGVCPKCVVKLYPKYDMEPQEKADNVNEQDAAADADKPHR